MQRSVTGISLVVIFITISMACNGTSPSPTTQANTPTAAQVLKVDSSTPTLTPTSPTATFTQIPSLTLTPTATVPPPTATPDFTSTPDHDNGRIFFTQCLSFASLCNIMVINADGTGLHRLTNASESTEPVLSPDGKKIAFISNREGGYGDVFVMNVDGSQVKRLTYDRGGDSYPAWSPDSKQIVFNQALQLSVSNSERFDEIAVIDSDGKNVHQLTHNTVIDYAPDWSPDGNKIAFDSGMNGKRGIFVMDPDGKNVKELTSGDKECFHPKWSPDGNQILSYCRIGKVDNIYVMNADGSNIHALFNSPAEESNLAAWSPDGKKIVFVRSVFRNKEWITRLFIGNIDGSNLHQLLVGKDTQNRDDYPFWAP